MIEALCSDAPRIRLGMLGASLRGDLDAILADLADRGVMAQQRAAELDTQITGLLAFLGYPAEESATRATLPAGEKGLDVLAWQEKLRRGRYTAPVEGEFDEHLKRLLESRLGEQRATALRKAEELVIGAFERKETMDGKAFERVYDEARLRSAGARIVNLAVDHLNKRLGLPRTDWTPTDLKLKIGRADVKGDAGQASRDGSNLARGLKILSGALFFGGPIGIAAGVILPFAFGGLQASMSRDAEAERAQARRAALGEVRSSVNATFDSIADQIRQAASNYRDACFTNVLAALLREAGTCQVVIEEVEALRKAIGKIVAKLDDLRPGDSLLKAVRRIEQRTYPDRGDGARLIWAGEDWIDDPDGLVAVAGPADDTTEQRVLASVVHWSPWQAPAVQRHVLAHGALFVAQAKSRLNGLEMAEPVLAELQELVLLGQPNIYLVGDYNAGKTTLIRRLLAEAGLPVPNDLEVKADPTTQSVVRHDWGGVWLIDTPGFRSTRAGDDLTALSALPDASLIIWLLNRTVLDETMEQLQSVLKGDSANGIPGKAARTILVVGRSDELGQDPVDQAGEFANLIARKRIEVSQALAAKGIDLPAQQICVVAADPFGLVGNEAGIGAEGYDAHRTWDGMVDLLKTLGDHLSGEQAPYLIDVAILEGGLARLSRLDRALASENAQWREIARQTADLIAKIDLRCSEAKTFRKRIALDIDRILEETTQSLLEGFWGAKDGDEEELRAAAQLLETWWDDPAFRQDLTRWEGRWVDEIDRWFRTAAEEAQRTMESREVQQVSLSLQKTFDADAFAVTKSSSGKIFGMLSKGAKQLGVRDRVYAIGKSIGYKFVPWEATKIARGFTRAAPVLAVANSVLELWSWRDETRKQAKKDEARREIARFVAKSREEIRDSLLGKGEERRGIAAYLADRCNGLDEVRRELKAAQDINSERLIRLAEDRIAVAEVAADGRGRLDVCTASEVIDA